MEVTKPTEMTKLLHTLNTQLYLLGLKGFWITDVSLSSRFIEIYNKIEYLIDLSVIFFTSSVVGSLFTQKDLSERLKMDRMIFSIILPGNMTFYYLLLHHKDGVKMILYHVVVVLKVQYNDLHLEQEMIKKIRVFSMMFLIIVKLIIVMYGLGAFYKVVTEGETFVTIVSAWPDVHDTSAAAGLMRVIFYFCWIPLSLRMVATSTLLITIMVTICFQFKNLQSYFYSLEDIFDDDALSQVEKEIKYEQAFKLGVQMHILTLWCKNQFEQVSTEIFAIEIVLYFIIMISELTTLLGNEHNMTQLFKLGSLMMGNLLILGFFMCTGGDVTIEASKLSEAMYSSGWQNCYGPSSTRIRKLVVNAMRQAQEPVVYKAYGMLEFSYESFVSLAKMPYTVVSVFY